MNLLKKLFRYCLYLLAIPVLYILVSLLLTFITVNDGEVVESDKHKIFLSSNGVHLDIVLPIEYIDNSTFKGLLYTESDRYLAFGWGDENFYIHTPTWSDLTFSNAFQALFLESTSLMHITKYTKQQQHWVEVKLSNKSLKSLKKYISDTFYKTAAGQVVILENAGYTSRDEFYRAKGSYSCLNTCNSWVNAGFKQAGLKSCYWTPFDFGLISKWETAKK